MGVHSISMQGLIIMVIASCFIANTVAQNPALIGLKIIITHANALCKNDTGTGSAEGAMVELRCNTTKGTTIVQNGTVISEGYFVIQTEGFNLGFQPNLCRVFPLRPPPNKTCTEFVDCQIAAYGAPLNPEIEGSPSYYYQYNVTTFVWKKPSPHY